MGCKKLTYGDFESTTFLRVVKSGESEIFGVNCYDYGARMYDPALGRFTTQDPLAETFNNQSPYLYAYNNPVRFTDYMGMNAVDEVKNTENRIVSTSTNDESGNTTVIEETKNITESSVRTENEDGTSTETVTKTTETITSTTVINSEGEIVSNEANTQTRELTLNNQRNENGVITSSDGVEKTTSPSQAIAGGFIGNKTEAISVIAYANNNERNGPWWGKREVQDIISGVTAPVTQPGNPGLQNRSGWGGVPFNASGYSRADSMRQQGKYYNGQS